MKPTSDSTAPPAPRTAERRSFIWKAGAVLSATVASAAAMAGGGTARATNAPGDAKELERLAHQLGLREDADAIRQLQQSFARALNERRYEDLVALFADDAEVHFNGNVFVGQARGVRQLYVEQFGRRFTDAHPEPAQACVVDSDEPCSIDVSADRQSATARFPCRVQIETALDGPSSLVEMARQQGQGLMHSWEHGQYENSYVKCGADWKIRELRYRAVGRAQSVEAAPNSISASRWRGADPGR